MQEYYCKLLGAAEFLGNVKTNVSEALWPKKSERYLDASLIRTGHSDTSFSGKV